MSKTIWVVFVMGIVALALLMVGLLATISEFSESPAGARARVAQGIRNRFGFESANVRVALEGRKKILLISYETRQDSKYDIALQQREMKEVVGHAVSKYEERDLREIEEIRVTRTEVKGRGCWENRQVARETYPNPARTAPDPFRFQPPGRTPE